LIVFLKEYIIPNITIFRYTDLSKSLSVDNSSRMPVWLNFLSKHTDVALAIGVVAILFILLFPIPTLILDIFLAFSVTTSIIILMTTLFITKPLELSSFPTLLLVTAMLRLSLNIASTRLILSEGHTGTAAAGHVIEAFGGFVMQGNIVIGLIVFIILTIINFMVITKGSGRIAEVAARFSLDAMPGKQMAIDADLSAGLINEEEAKARRKELEQESAFYGSMDGANKFVRGDAIAGILITFINLIGGIVIGVVQRSLTFNNAMHTYTILTIGDGLVSQIPSLIISLSAGLLVSKAGVIGSADKAIFGQLGKYPQALWLSSAVTGLVAFLPGLPFMPFATLSFLSGFIAYAIKNSLKNIGKDGFPAHDTDAPMSSSQSSTTDPKELAKTQEDMIAETLQMDAIRLELGYSLLPLINYQHGNKLTDQIKALRKQIAKDYGFIMPAVRIQDNLQLENNEYIIKLKEIECGKGIIQPDKILVMNPTGSTIDIEGEHTKEPAFGLPAKWIGPEMREEAMFNNYTVVDPPTVITTHMTELIKENITELITYSETQNLLDKISEEHKKLVRDMVPDQIQISTLQKILQNLLREGISIRDLAGILEGVADGIKSTSNLINLTELVRMKISRQISHLHASEDGFLPVVVLSPEWEQNFTESLVGDDNDRQLSMPPSKLNEFVQKIKKIYDEQALKGDFPVLLTSGKVRPYVRSVIERFRPTTFVMSQNEVHFKSKIKTLGVV
jgi:flagellar biosynthesis protein FlhA